MSASDGVKQTAAQSSRVKYSRLKYLRDNAVAYFTLFGRKPRCVLTKPAPLHVGAGILGAVATIMVTMMVLDARSISVVARLPQWLIASFDRITDFGNSVRFLVPIALVLVVMAVLASPALPAMSRRVLAAVAVRLGFLFSAIALPGLVVTIVKRLIGRARPLVGGSADPFRLGVRGYAAGAGGQPLSRAGRAVRKAALHLFGVPGGGIVVVRGERARQERGARTKLGLDVAVGLRDEHQYDADDGKHAERGLLTIPGF